MLYKLPFCEINFPSNLVCVIQFFEGVDVDEEKAIKALMTIREHSDKKLFLIFDKSNSYSYQMGALQLLCNRKMFSKVYNVVKDPDLCCKKILDLEMIISDRKIENAPSIEYALSNIKNSQMIS